MLAYRETAHELCCPSEVTGTPVRPAFFEVPPLASRGASAKRPPHLLVLGGSQGARQLNELVPVALAAVARRLARGVAGLEITHQCGRAHVEAAQAAYVAADVASAFVRVTPFLEDVAGAMAAADVVICRAGAMTVAEVAAAGRPAVFIPLAVAAGHQLDNVRELVEAGAARLLAPAEASSERLAAVVAELLADRGALAAMGEAARRLARPDAAARIADQAERWASGGRGAARGLFARRSPRSTEVRP
jgi:UDP-N-acetylglucosamine--N-acetylmuramyl-(pentapeptide) pyrophosphoryl-undecaprenol N-acetylglucosamine transferase